MSVSKTAPPSPIPKPLSLTGGIWVSREFKLSCERIPFNVDVLMRTPLSNRPWKLYRIPADQIEAINSDWHQLSSAPGIHVAGKSYGSYRVAIDDAYLPWLSVSKFKFQPDLNPMKPLEEEASVQGIRVAIWNAITRFFRDAIEAVSSGKGPGLDSVYLTHAQTSHQLALEWAILKRDLKLDPKVKTRFTQWLLFITLNLVDDYNTPLMLAILRKNEDELLQAFWNLHTDLSTYLPSTTANFKAGVELTAAQNSVELHRISLFLLLLDFVQDKKDVRQHKFDLEYTANDNANIFGSMNGISGSKPFGIFDSQKMLDALFTSPIFPGDTARKFIKSSAKLMGHLPIGFPDGYLDLPFDVLSKLSYGQVFMIHAQMVHFYHCHPSLNTPKNNVLVLLACNPIDLIFSQVLVKWATSDAGLRIYERIIKGIQECQKTEHLVLALAALLCYQRLLPVTHNDQPIKGSYQADFHAILSGEHLGNEPTVLEHMGFSVLRVYYTVKDNEKMRRFLAAVLSIKPPVLDPFHEFSDRYWIYRMKSGLAHKDACKMAGFECWTEEIVGRPAILDHGKAVIEILNNEEQEEEAMVEESTDDGWVMVKTLKL
ncbi:hypothetical protein B0J14DRAFT_113998 [Halenospora varia]|nr:hypothetical protein B0J14DRAFT_113998 [Halenospora varia]